MPNASVDFRLHCEDKPGYVLAAPSGDLDHFTSAAFDAALVRIQEDGPKVVVLDLTDVRLIDSTGLRSLLGVARRGRAAGHRVVVIRGSETVRSVFRICGIEQFFELADSIDELAL